jgi:hypothetical protein
MYKTRSYNAFSIQRMFTCKLNYLLNTYYSCSKVYVNYSICVCYNIFLDGASPIDIALRLWHQCTILGLWHLTLILWHECTILKLWHITLRLWHKYTIQGVWHITLRLWHECTILRLSHITLRLWHKYTILGYMTYNTENMTYIYNTGSMTYNTETMT